MKSTRKYKIQSLLLRIGLILPFFVSAQSSSPSLQQPTTYDDNGGGTCKVCGGTPKQIEDFVTMVTEILGILGTKYTAGIQAGQYKTFGPRQGGLYGNIMGDTSNNQSIYKNIVDGTLRNIDQKQSSIRTTTVLIGMYGRDIITDGALGFAVIAQPWPMVRDYQRLLDIDTMITDKIYEMGLAGGYNRQIDSSTIESIRELMDKETGEKKIFSNIKIQNSMEAKDILQVLVKINKKHKNMVVLSKKQKSDSEEDINKNNTIIIDLNTGYRNDIKQEYACARLGGSGSMKCSNQFSQFKKSIKNIKKNFIENGPKKSREKIKTASRRLKTRAQQIAGNTNTDSYKKNLEEYEQREAELLSIQGVQKRTSNTLTGFLGDNPIRSIVSQFQKAKMKIPSISNTIKDQIEKIKSNTLQGAETQKDIQGNKNQEKGENPIDVIKSFFKSDEKSKITIAIEKKLITDLEYIMADHDQQIQFQSLASSDDSIQQLTETLRKIRLLNNTIYDPGNQNTIYENIVRTCELQCSNLGGTCR